jgi:serine/threonine-protein kinase
VLRLKTLGGLGIQRDDAPPGGGATQRRRLALLALLARAGDRGLSRDKLLGYLWPESEPEKARGVLAQALYALRRDLGAEELFLGTSDLRLNPTLFTSDVAEFCAALQAGRLDDAVSLYEGPFLDGIYVNDAPEFERWAEVERTQLAGEHADALDRLAAQATARGDHRAAVAWWRKLAAADPLSARVATGLMRALAAAGDRGGAIQHARVYESLLRQELDAAPDPEIVRLAEQLRQEPVASPVSAPGAAAARSADVPAPVTRGVEPVAPPSSPVQGPPVPAPLVRVPASGATRPGAPRVAVAVFLLALVAGAALLGKRVVSRGTPAEVGTGRRMIAVLPFQNLGRPDDEYFADGLTEEVTSRLATIGGLGVISRTSSMQYKRTDKSLRQIARELGVSYVLEGSVRWEHTPDGGSRVRVTPQLIQVSDDSHLWAERYDADIADVFRVQGEIAEEVAKALDVTLSGTVRQALGARLTDSLSAYDQYLRGNVYLDRAWGDEVSLRAAVKSYQDAVRMDSGFALARARLAMAQAMVFRLLSSSEEQLRLAKAQADTALRLEADLPEGHTALGYYWYWGHRDYGRARAEFQRALDLRPNDPDVLSGLGAVERRQGQWGEAVAHLQRSADLDPRSSDKAWNAALACLFQRNYAASERYLDRAITLSPNWAYPYGTKADLYLAWYGDREKAAQAVRQYPVSDIHQLYGALGTTSWLMGEDSARRLALDKLRLKDFGVDTLSYYKLQAEWHDRRGEPAVARSYWDSMTTTFERGSKEQPLDDQYLVGTAIGYSHLGRGSDAVKALARAEQVLPLARDAAWGPDRAVYFADVYMRVGEIDSAIAITRRLLTMPSRITAARLRVDPIWDPVRSDPRFQQMVREGK